MNEKKIVGVVEFHSFEGDPDVGTQINDWLSQYPEVTIMDSKYEIVSYIEDNIIKFAMFALIFFHEPESPPQVNRATTQRMQLPPSARLRREGN